MTVNVTLQKQRALAARILDFILAPKETELLPGFSISYDQRTWTNPINANENEREICGTTCCVAGSAVAFSDPERYASVLKAIAKRYGNFGQIWALPATTEVVNDSNYDDIYSYIRGKVPDTGKFYILGADALGIIKNSQRDFLFDEERTPEQVISALGHFIATGSWEAAVNFTKVNFKDEENDDDGYCD